MLERSVRWKASAQIPLRVQVARSSQRGVNGAGQIPVLRTLTCVH